LVPKNLGEALEKHGETIGTPWGILKNIGKIIENLSKLREKHRKPHPNYGANHRKSDKNLWAQWKSPNSMELCSNIIGEIYVPARPRSRRSPFLLFKNHEMIIIGD